MNKQKIRDNFRVGAIFFGLLTLLFATQFALYIKGSTVADMMDFSGWTFFFASCVSHAATIALVLFLAYLPFAMLRLRKAGLTVMTILASLVSILIFLNMQVYDIYRFHINGMVLNMVFGNAAADIFTFDAMLYVKEILMFLFLVALCIMLCVAACKVHSRCSRHLARHVFGIVILATLYAHGYHIYGSFVQQRSVVKSAQLLPYYFPTTSYGLMIDLGVTPPQNALAGVDDVVAQSGDVIYPINALQTDEKAEKPNILFIAIDSWNPCALTPETMPVLYDYANANLWFTNHFGCSNGTRSSIFGMFFSLPSIYWNTFEAGGVSPLFIDELLRQGYACQVYPSASIMSPPFFRVVFQKIDSLNVETEGATVLDRDEHLTNQCITDMRRHKQEGKPFFSFLFYDLPHSFQLPADRLNRFTPTWTFADYTRLDNDTDPTPFFNLYRHTCYEDDRIVGRLLQALEDEGLAENTIVIITGDHGQEFNENKKNYWGHNGNFSRWQVAVPLIARFPNGLDGKTTDRIAYRTTHYDLVPTLMREALGVSNPPSDYSAGHLLSDSCSRSWHVVGSELNYAFIIGGDTILEKTAQGSLDVYDASMNVVSDYAVSPREFNAAIQKLNRFMK